MVSPAGAGSGLGRTPGVSWEVCVRVACVWRRALWGCPPPSPSRTPRHLPTGERFACGPNSFVVFCPLWISLRQMGHLACHPLTCKCKYFWPVGIDGVFCKPQFLGLSGRCDSMCAPSWRGLGGFCLGAHILYYLLGASHALTLSCHPWHSEIILFLDGPRKSQQNERNLTKWNPVSCWYK